MTGKAIPWERVPDFLAPTGIEELHAMYVSATRELSQSAPAASLSTAEQQQEALIQEARELLNYLRGAGVRVTVSRPAIWVSHRLRSETEARVVRLKPYIVELISNEQDVDAEQAPAATFWRWIKNRVMR